MPFEFYGDTALDGDGLRRIDALISTYRRATGRLLEIEARLADGSYSRRYMREQIEESFATIEKLFAIRQGQATGDVVEWARGHFPAVYGYGAGRALDDFAEIGFGAVRGRTRIHTQALDSLVSKYLDETHEVIVELQGNTLRAARIVLRDASFADDMAAGIIGGLPRREISTLLRRRLNEAMTEAIPLGEKPAIAEIRVGKRSMTVDAWAEMHARTESARASTAGNRAVCTENGVFHVRITSHSHPPCICTPFEGRIYSLREGDPEFPYIGRVPNGGCPMHPNCVHREGPAVVKLMRERGDIGDRGTIPPEFDGLSPSELAKKIRENRDVLDPFARAPNGYMPADFRVGKPPSTPAAVNRRVEAAKKAVAPAEVGSVFPGPTFEPALSVAEARATGARLAGHYGYDGAKLGELNEINAGIATVTEPFGVKLGATDWIGAGPVSRRGAGRALGIYRHRIGGPDRNDQLGIQKTFGTNAAKKAAEQKALHERQRARHIAEYETHLSNPKLSEAVKDTFREKLVRQTNAVRWSTLTDSPRPLFSTAAHEAGHAIYYRTQMGNDFARLISKAKIPRSEWYTVSEYAGSQISELFAEVTALYAEGRSALVPKAIRNAYEETLRLAKARLPAGT